MHRLARLLAPESIAVVGGRPAELAIQQCMALGFEGEIWPVHPTRSEQAGHATVPTVADLPGPPDAALVAVNRHETIQVVAALAAMGAGAAVCYASGFAEVGGAGIGLQADLVAAARSMPVVGPNCYGTVAATVGAALWPDQQGLQRCQRGVALVTQSGNIALNLTMQSRRMPISHVLTVGNQADVGVEECVEALVGDPSVSAIGLHVEALGDVPRFEAACRRASAADVPMVVLKTGSSTLGARIVVSHTSSLVGDATAYRALFQRLGVRQVDSIPELLDTLAVLDRLGGISGRRLVSMSCSGGEASVVADQAESMDLDLPAFDDAHAARIADTLSDLVSVSNPLDYHTFIWGDPERLRTTFTAVMDGPLDAAMLVLDFPSTGLDDSGWWPTLGAFAEASRATGVPGVVVASMAENLPPEVETAADVAGMVAVRGIGEALKALEASAWWGDRRTRPPLLEAEPFDRKDLRTLYEVEARGLLEAAGVPVPRGLVVPVVDAVVASASLTGRVVVKATGMAHKTEAGRVAVDLAGAAEVGAALAGMGLADDAPVLVEEFVDDAVVELLVSVRREPPVGWLLTLGIGGTLVELLGDTTSLLLPVDADEVLAALRGLAGWPLIEGHRGNPPADLDALVATILGIVGVVEVRPDLVELECNPVLARPVGAITVDALAIVVD
ncbi:MAG: acetate--CoA ligase family protein [Acidimicrobiales bacterium]|jgi:acyl-CoA synthetase (NDP forming)|nr:acetate--CoA ligase family protein [Acidimicrobiales bacterium]